MRLLCISDIHGKIEDLRRLSEKNPEGDLLIVSGDITQFGGKEAAREVLEELFKINKNILAVSGNCDRKEINEVLAELNIGLHSTNRIINNISFFGVSGSTKTPFHTPQEYSEEEIKEFLEGYKGKTVQEKEILVSHSPPYGTKLDAISDGRHIGSIKIGEFIEKTQPDLVVCGHAHEARGTEKIGKTLVVNPGALHMGYAVVAIGKNIEVKFESY